MVPASKNLLKLFTLQVGTLGLLCREYYYNTQYDYCVPPVPGMNGILDSVPGNAVSSAGKPGRMSDILLLSVPGISVQALTLNYRGKNDWASNPYAYDKDRTALGRQWHADKQKAKGWFSSLGLGWGSWGSGNTNTNKGGGKGNTKNTKNTHQNSGGGKGNKRRDPVEVVEGWFSSTRRR